MAESDLRWAMFKIAQLMKNPSKQRDIFMALDWKSGFLEETFIKQDYAWLAERLKPNTVVLDLGGAIGDSAIYLAGLKNVSRVISLEPVPKVYEIGKKLIAESPERIRNKIEFSNAAISDKEGKSLIQPNSWSGTAVSTRTEDHGISISKHTIDSLTKGVTNPIAIKCDIEGDEKMIFTNADLSKVYAIQLEHHWNSKELVRGILEGKGFKTVDLNPMNEMGCALMGAWRE